MDGLLIVDKPSGPTSHDVVARMRRALGERRIGHTGTLDPLASGVLPLVIGRATRLAQFLSAADKEYEAVIALGIETDTCDALGAPLGAPYDGPLPDHAAIDRALDRFRGTFLQQPPAFSAKKIAGVRSYTLARARRSEATARESQAAAGAPDLPDPPGLPGPVLVTAHAIRVVAVSGPAVTVSVTCSAGFYVRSLAHDLGRVLGTGACLSELRRTRSGAFSIEESIRLEDAERDPDGALDGLVPMRALLAELPSAVLTDEGRIHARQGRELRHGDFAREPGLGVRVRLLDESGELLGIASPGSAPGLLHPSIVLM